VPATGDVQDHGAALQSAGTNPGFDPDDAGPLFFLCEFKLSAFLSFGREDLLQVCLKCGALAGGDQHAEGATNELGSSDVNHGCTCEIRELDAAFAGEGEVADQCEVIELCVFIQQSLRLVPCTAEFRVLKFQLNLVNVEFMEHPPGVGIGRDGGWLLHQFLGTASECVRAWINLGFDGHDEWVRFYAFSRLRFV
jgi:hypothetical protein